MERWGKPVPGRGHAEALRSEYIQPLRGRVPGRVAGVREDGAIRPGAGETHHMGTNCHWVKWRTAAGCWAEESVSDTCLQISDLAAVLRSYDFCNPSEGGRPAW